MKHIHYIIIICVLLLIIVVLVITRNPFPGKERKKLVQVTSELQQPIVWTPPDTADIPVTAAGNQIRYGRELIIHTAQYFGPRGKISQAENGLNCQNCHIAAGTRLFANNFSKVAATYPKYRARRNQYVSIAGRINGCMERSMNGQPIDTNSREMKALIAYFKWIGKGVNGKTKLFGEGTEAIPFLNRPADPSRGKTVFMNTCASCHGKNGEGKLNQDSTEYLYPPLWGPHSYNVGAGLYQISKFASYVKNNMPYGTTYHNPVLTDEQAWDVAAFVNSQPHPPFKGIQKDWPDISKKSFDYPFGPYADSFSEKQHKYGPYKAIMK